MFPRVNEPKRKKAGTEDEFPPIFFAYFSLEKTEKVQPESVSIGTAICFFGFHSRRAAKREVEWT